MAYEPRSTDTATPLDAHTSGLERASITAHAQHTLRLGSLSMDTRTGVVRWHGELVKLNADDRILLAEMLRHAGQIMSREHLATRLHLRRDRLESHMRTLIDSLREAGVRIVPREVDGCGYLLWR